MQVCVCEGKGAEGLQGGCRGCRGAGGLRGGCKGGGGAAGRALTRVRQPALRQACSGGVAVRSAG